MTTTNDQCETRAFLLSVGIAAVATHNSADSKQVAMVQIMCMAGGSCIVGRQGLLALQAAVQFALEGDPT